MIFCKLLKHDLHYGLLWQWHKLLPAAIYALFSCVIFDKHIQNAVAANMLSANAAPSVLDYIANMLKGIDVYRFDIKGGFQIPALWCLFFIGFFFQIGHYTNKDLYGFGTSILLQSKSRRLWWVSKIVWIIASAIVYMLIIVICVAVFCFAKGGFTIALSEDITSFYLSETFYNQNTASVLLTLFATPLLVLATFGIFQTAIGFITSPIIGITAAVVLLAASIYFYTPLFLGNFSVLRRSEVLIGGFVNFQNAFLCCAVFAAIMIFCGLIYFEHTDILKKE